MFLLAYRAIHTRAVLLIMLPKVSIVWQRPFVCMVICCAKMNMGIASCFSARLCDRKKDESESPSALPKLKTHSGTNFLELSLIPPPVGA